MSSIESNCYATFIELFENHFAPYLAEKIAENYSVEIAVEELVSFLPDCKTKVQQKASSSEAEKPKRTSLKRKADYEQYTSEDDRCHYQIRGAHSRRCDGKKVDDYLCEYCLKKTGAFAQIRKLFPDENPYPENTTKVNKGGAAPKTGTVGGAKIGFGGNVARPGTTLFKPKSKEPLRISIEPFIYYEKEHNFIVFGDQTRGYNIVGKLDKNGKVIALDDDDKKKCEELKYNFLTKKNDYLGKVYDVSGKVATTTVAKPNGLKITVKKPTTATTAAASPVEETKPKTNFSAKVISSSSSSSSAASSSTSKGIKVPVTVKKPEPTVFSAKKIVKVKESVPPPPPKVEVEEEEVEQEQEEEQEEQQQEESKEEEQEEKEEEGEGEEGEEDGVPGNDYSEAVEKDGEEGDEDEEDEDS
jgi:hypothetical protein